MKKFLLGFALIAAIGLAISSCSKEDDNGNNAAGNVKSEYKGGDYLYNYTYDSEGRISLVQYVYKANGVNSRKITYGYTLSTVAISGYDSASNNAVNTFVYHLNSDGLIIDGRGYHYNYDGERHLTGIIDTLTGDYTYQATYLDGNMISEVVGAYPNISYLNYTYITDKIDHRDFGTPFAGKRSTNLVSTMYTSIDTTTYTYEYDPLGRVTTETRTNPGLPGISLPRIEQYSYTYY